MKLLSRAAAVALTLWLLQVCATAQLAGSPYHISDGVTTVHIYPTPEYAKQIKAQQGSEPSPYAGSGVLTYQGGPVMTSVNLYAIMWLPPTLQNGSPTSVSSKYQTVIRNFLNDYSGHGISNNSTQYYQIVSGITSYIRAFNGLSGWYLDNSAYPASGCTDGVTGTNCITDAQVQAEITKVMGLRGWTPGPGKIFLVFTSNGEGSCFDSSGGSCAYTQYCAYHGYFGPSNNPTIYGNMPYANITYCKGGQNSPSGDAYADALTNVTSHEVTEATTDPQLNAWYDTSNGEEIGDLCAWNFGTRTWDSGIANQMWNGNFYDLQLEYDNHQAACVSLGP
jgi:hypothetical protein